MTLFFSGIKKRPYRGPFLEQLLMSEKHDNSITEANFKPSPNSSIHIYNSALDEWQHSEEDIKLAYPFHLTTTNHSGKKEGMTGSLPNEIVSYEKVATIKQFLQFAKFDLSASQFQDNHRSEIRFLRSDVLVADIDNDNKLHPEYWNDEKNRFTLNDFALMFEPYSYVLKTSRNHQKQKIWSDGTIREPRDKFHAFFPMPDRIEDRGEYQELLEILQYFTKEEYEQNRLDVAVGAYSQLFGHEDTQIYYNQGKNISKLLNGDFRATYNEHRSNNSRSKYITSGEVEENQEDVSTTEKVENWKQTWDYINIVEPTELKEFYPTLIRKTGSYYMAVCELHDDHDPSLQVFPTGGFNCLADGCLSGFSPLHYEAKRDGKTVREVRKEWCKKLHLDHNEYLMDKSCWEGDIELEGYVPVTNLAHLFISHAAYRTLKQLNNEYAVASVEGDVILLKHTKTSYHQDFQEGYKTQIFQAMPKFKDQYNNHFVSCKQKNGVKKVDKIGEDGEAVKEDGKVVKIEETKWKTTIKTLGAIWLEWHDRREYDRAIFYPSDQRKVYKEERVWDYFDDWESATWGNNWIGTDGQRGLTRFIDKEKFSRFTSVEQAKDACSLYISHIENILCGNYHGNQKKMLSEYIIKWMASCVSKHLDDRCTVALVLQSGQGTGKGMFSKFFGQLFGGFFYHLMNANRLGNTFNMLMKDRLLVFIDEAVWGGDKSQTGLVRAMQTESTMVVEMKFMNAFVANNHRRFIYSSNSEWIVAKEVGGRRFQVIDVKNQKMSKKKYLEIKYEWDTGGKEGFYYYLTSPEMQEAIHNYDFEKGMIETKGGMQQIMETQPELGWWYEILQDGGHQVKSLNGFGQQTGDLVICPWDDKTENKFHGTGTQNILDSYKNYHPAKFNGTKSTLSQKLSKLNQQGIIFFETKRLYEIANDPMGWIFEGISAARKRWDDHFNNGEDSFG